MDKIGDEMNGGIRDGGTSKAQDKIGRAIIGI
jgi:hypothetical protein